jgi:hypothetical protein
VNPRDLQRRSASPVAHAPVIPWAEVPQLAPSTSSSLFDSPNRPPTKSHAGNESARRYEHGEPEFPGRQIQGPSGNPAYPAQQRSSAPAANIRSPVVFSGMLTPC